MKFVLLSFFSILALSLLGQDTVYINKKQVHLEFDELKAIYNEIDTLNKEIAPFLKKEKGIYLLDSTYRYLLEQFEAESEQLSEQEKEDRIIQIESAQWRRDNWKKYYEQNKLEQCLFLKNKIDACQNRINRMDSEIIEPFLMEFQTEKSLFIVLNDQNHWPDFTQKFIDYLKE